MTLATSHRAGDRTRTGDVQLGKLAFYQLNYARRTAPELYVPARTHSSYFRLYRQATIPGAFASALIAWLAPASSAGTFTSCVPSTFPVVSRNSQVSETGVGFRSLPAASVALRPV